MRIVFYEDEGWENLQPLSLTRPVWELRCGIKTLWEKAKSTFPEAEFSFICRDYLAPLVKMRRPDSTVNEFRHSDMLFLNARVIWDDAKIFAELLANTEFYLDGKFAGGLIKGALNVEGVDWQFDKVAENLHKLLKFKERMCGLFRREVKAKIVEYPWDLVEFTGSEIAQDIKNSSGLRELRQADFSGQGIYLVPGGGVFTDGEVKIMPGVVLDSSEGPIFLGDGVNIMPNAVIQGPVSIGAGSTVKIGAKIYEGTSIGPVCKIGGEVAETVIQGYSNKQHEGFLGHAVVGEWCNFGAGTENSDLKNNYGPVKVQLGDKRVNSGQLFIGLYMGDHSKTGINTTFNTGTVVGVGSMAFGAGFQPRYIPSFTWSDGGKFKKADFDDTIKTAGMVMQRRHCELSEAEMEVLRYLYDQEEKRE